MIMYKITSDITISEVQIQGFDPEYPERFIVLKNGSRREINTSHTKWRQTEDEAIVVAFEWLNGNIQDAETRLEKVKQDREDFIQNLKLLETY